MAEGGELVVLLDEGLNHIGSADKATVHTRSTPLHLAFSCYIDDGTGNVLVTRRALGKRTWPGVWTNSCCGHPAPGEDGESAVRRRVRQELGLELDSLRLALPSFRYRAVSPEGIVENEFCPVYVATTSQRPHPAPEEVAEYEWVHWPHLVALARDNPWILSPWATRQILLLEEAAVWRR